MRNSTESAQYGREELTVAPIEGAVLADQLAEAVQHIEGNYTAGSFSMCRNICGSCLHFTAW